MAPSFCVTLLRSMGFGVCREASIAVAEWFLACDFDSPWLCGKLSKWRMSSLRTAAFDPIVGSTLSIAGLPFVDVELTATKPEVKDGGGAVVV